MRKTLSLVLVLAVATLGVPVVAFAAPVKARAQQATGGITGTAKNAQGQNLSNYTVRVRSVSNGSIAGSTTSSNAGAFSFSGLTPGNYIVEVVDAAGKVVGLSPSLAVTAGATLSVSVSAAAVGAMAAASAGGFSLFGLGTIASVAVITGASIAVIAGIVAVNNNSSPSR